MAVPLDARSTAEPDLDTFTSSPPLWHGMRAAHACQCEHWEVSRVIGADLRHLDANGTSLAYRLRDGGSPRLLFLPGYASDMEGAKATGA